MFLRRETVVVVAFDDVRVGEDRAKKGYVLGYK